MNGREVMLPGAPSLADALRAVGVHLPALCHDERLAPTGACRLCLVRINGAERPVPACATPVAEGLRIDTSPPDVEAARRGTLQMPASHYPAAAICLRRGGGRGKFAACARNPTSVAFVMTHIAR